MRFKLYTLVDITETGARKGDETKPIRQQQNFLTVIQTIGLRANPEYSKSPSVIQEIPKKVGLGTEYKTKQNIWEFNFDIPFEGALSLDILNNDFNYIPIITNLDETVKFEKETFLTNNSALNNIIFIEIDK